MAKLDSEDKYNFYKLGYYEGKCEAYERLLVKCGMLARICEMHDKIFIKEDGEIRHETTK